MKKVWDAIVFDLDGTLADTLRDLAEATNVALVENGFSSWPLDHYRIMVGNGLRKLIERATGGAPSPVVDRVMADFVRIYDRDCLRFTRAYDDMPETLAALRAAGTRLLVVTNKPDAQAQKIVAHLYGVGLFDGVFGNREGRKTKPDPCLTLESLSSVNVLPARSLFVGDSDVDIYTAKSAGMKSAGVTWGFREVEELGAAGADFILYNPTEILNTY